MFDLKKALRGTVMLAFCLLATGALWATEGAEGAAATDRVQNELQYHDWILVEFCVGQCQGGTCCLVL